jgi:hypothetical protein
MTEQLLLDEIEKIENYLPSKYDDLIQQIDKYIFGAQRGFDACTELLVLYCNQEAMAMAVFKKAYAVCLLDAEAKKVPVSGRGDYAKSRTDTEDCNVITADNNVRIARLRRDKFLERLNTYKKIKGDNTNMRGNG